MNTSMKLCLFASPEHLP